MRELKTWISEETGPEATIDALRSMAPYCRIVASRARESLIEVERSVASWREEATALGFAEHESELFADAFEHEERRAVQRLR